MNRNKRYWRICCALVILLSILSFTPLVIPVGISKPFFLGMPYTLWVGMLIAFLLVFLVFIGTKVRDWE